MNLARYFAGHKGDQFTGRHFEHYAAMGHPDRFVPSDLLAIETLSVSVPTEVAAQLLIENNRFFSELLADIPANIDIWDVPDPSSMRSPLLPSCIDACEPSMMWPR